MLIRTWGKEAINAYMSSYYLIIVGQNKEFLIYDYGEKAYVSITKAELGLKLGLPIF